MSLTLVGDVILSLALTNWADHLGRRQTTMLGSALMVASGVVFAAVSNYWILLFAAIFGVISPSGNEIGPFRAVEEGMLASLVNEGQMSDIFAWHIVAGTLGVSFGTFSTGWILGALQSLAGWTVLHSYRAIFALYAAIGCAKLLVATRLSRASEIQPKSVSRGDTHDAEEARSMLRETEEPDPKRQNGIFAARKTILRSCVPSLSRSTWSILWKLCLLFALDSFASGMVALYVLMACGIGFHRR